MTHKLQPQYPDFLVIGAAKSGTTALYYNLEQHPDIYMSPAKEPNHFAFTNDPLNAVIKEAKYVGKMEREYVNPDTYLALFAKRQSEKMAGECSISTLYFPRAMPAVLAANPSMKLVALLRHPVERAYSSFHYARYMQIEPETDFSIGMQKEKQRLADDCHMLLRYRDAGLYHKQLLPFFQNFPPEQIHIILYDDFVENPKLCLSKLMTFFGVDPDFSFDTLKKENVTTLPVKRHFLRQLTYRGVVNRVLRSVMPWELRKWVKRQLAPKTSTPPPKIATQEWNAHLPLFEEDIKALSKLIDRDLSDWLKFKKD